MKLEALITVDLPGATEDKRNKFYEKLKEKKWEKIKSLTTAWKASFNEDANIKGAVVTLKNDINKAKNYSNITKVYFAIQVGVSEIEVG